MKRKDPSLVNKLKMMPIFGKMRDYQAIKYKLQGLSNPHYHTYLEYAFLIHDLIADDLVIDRGDKRSDQGVL